jgi:GT2 family glycosyltransferase
LDALLAQTLNPDELVLVDHASKDGSAEKIREAYPDLEVIEISENRGPVAGMNRGARELLNKNVDAILVMPDDCRLAPDALEHLTARLGEDPGLGAVGPLVAHLNEPDRIFYAGGYLDPRTWDFRFRQLPAALSDWEGKPPHEVQWLEVFMARAAAVRETGPMYEGFYYWGDDCDYTVRMRSLGWRLECVPAAVAWQDLGYPASQYLVTRNMLGLIARNAPKKYLVRELMRVVYHLIRSTVRPKHPSQRSDVWPRLRGLVDFCRGRWGPPPASLEHR